MFTVCIQFHSTENPPGDKIHKSSQPAAPTPHSERKKEEKQTKRKKKERYYLVKQEQENENIDKSTWELGAFAWKLQKTTWLQAVTKQFHSVAKNIQFCRQAIATLLIVAINAFLTTTLNISNNIKKFREAISITKSLLNSSY